MASAPMILCDANVLSEFLKRHPSIVAELHTVGQDRLAISVVTKAELFYGALNKVELRYLMSHLGARVSELFIQMMERYALSYWLSIPDALIGAMALVWNMELFSLNVKDFRFLSDLKFYRPTPFS